MKGIYKFLWDCGRNGDLQGMFLATSEQVEKAIGKRVYFGEVLGKHSDISGTLEAGDVELVTDDPAAVEMFAKYKLTMGFNPLNIIAEREAEDE